MRRFLSSRSQPSHEYSPQSSGQFWAWSPCWQKILRFDPYRCVQVRSHLKAIHHLLVEIRLWEYSRIHLMQPLDVFLDIYIFDHTVYYVVVCYSPGWLCQRLDSEGSTHRNGKLRREKCTHHTTQDSTQVSDWSLAVRLRLEVKSIGRWSWSCTWLYIRKILSIENFCVDCNCIARPTQNHSTPSSH